MTDIHDVCKIFILIFAIWAFILLICEGLLLMPIAGLALVFVNMLMNAYEHGAES